MNKLFIIASREYLKVVRKPTFWISTLALPVFIIIITLISGFSATQAEERIKSQLENSTSILIVDDAEIIESVSLPFIESGDLDIAIQNVKEGKTDGLIYFPEEIYIDKKIYIYQKDLGIFFSSRLNDVAVNLIKENLLQSIDNPLKIEAFKSNFQFEVKQYDKNQNEVSTGLEMFVVPVIATAIYFLLTTFSSTFMLLSVSEEKENRTIEIILSAVNNRQLIWGKIAGLFAIAVTQVLLLLTISLLVITFLNPDILKSINFSLVDLSIEKIALAIFYTINGFLFLSAIMAGVGASMPNYKDAANLSSIFIILSMIPIYFVTLIVSDPNGTISLIFSYFPFTAPILLLFRSSISAMTPAELIFSIFIILFYTYLSLQIALKLFKLGSLEYNSPIKIKSLFKIFSK